jgi:hypothetical protein
MPAANTPPAVQTEYAPSPNEHVQRIVDQQRQMTAEELARPWQNVVLKNTSAEQTFFISDRTGTAVELRPGQQREVAMVVTELQNLLHQARGDRGYFESGPRKGQAFPAHPVRVLGIGATQEAPTLK